MFDGHIISLINKHVWESYQYKAGEGSGFPVKIDIEIIPEKNILSYSAAFQLALYKRLSVIEVPAEATSAAISEYREEKIFKSRAVIILSLFFILLLVNFLLYNHYNSSNNNLIEKVSKSTSMQSNAKQLEEDLRLKEGLVKALGWNKGIRYAFILDQIGQTVPAAITLTALNINYGSALSVHNAQPDISYSVKISGETPEVRMVNNWIYVLRDKDWVKEVNMNNFEPHPESGQQKFSLTILY